jgi:CubicO group peptidase (beta-lactamase class C family)
MKYLNKEEIMKRHSPILIYVVCVMISFVFACNKSGGLFKDPYSRKTDTIDLLPGAENPDFILDKEKLSQLVESIENGKFGNIHSLVIIHNDDLVLEKYFRGWNRDMLHPCQSATKSITSALIGIAIAQGKVGSVNDKILDLLPEYMDVARSDERKNELTLKHVLSMSAGFVWNEHTPPYEIEDGVINPENDAVKLGYSDDCVRYLLELPLQYDPGSVFTYNTGCSMLLSKILQAKTNQTKEDFARDNLFHPLGITIWKWINWTKWKDWPSQDFMTHSGGNLEMRPIDMAMFVYLFLKNGKFNNTQIIPEEWVKESTTERFMTLIGGYGYQWWSESETIAFLRPDIDGIHMYSAQGYQGQFIMVIPHLDMVVVTTAKNKLLGLEGQGIVFDGILSALKKIRD